MSIGVTNQTFHVTGNASSSPVNISALNLDDNTGSDSFLSVRCTNTNSNAYTQWSSADDASAFMGLFGPTNHLLITTGTSLSDARLIEFDIAGKRVDQFADTFFYFANTPGGMTFQLENQGGGNVSQTLYAYPPSVCFTTYLSQGVGGYYVGMNGNANEFTIGLDSPGSSDAFKINNSGTVIVVSNITINSAEISSPDNTNIQVAGITFDGTNILNQYSGEQVFNPELQFDGSSGFDNGPGTGQVVLIGQVYFWSFSIVLGVNTGAVGGTAKITNLPPGSSTANIILSSTACNLTSGYQMVMDQSGFLYEQNSNSGTPPTALVQTNFGEGSLIQGQGFFFA